MELELQKRKLICYEPVLDTCTNHEETSDAIVPDSSPDILRILGAFGNAFLKDESMSEGRYTVSGTVSGWVLYVSEGDMNIRRLEVNLPFSHTFEHSEITSDQIGVLEIRLSGFEAREINPRKITVRANIALCAKTYRDNVIELPESVMGAADNGIECKKRRIIPFLPIAIKKKNIHIGDDIELSAGMPEFASMLRYDAAVGTCDTKIIGAKAIVKGTVDLTCVYLTKNSEIARFTRNLPFSQILEIEELCDTCRLDIKMHIGDFKLEPQYDMAGEVHYFALSLPLRICAIVWSQNEMEVLDDLYSLRCTLGVQTSVQTVNSVCEHLQKRVSVVEKIPCETQPEQILDVSACVEPVGKRREEDETALVNRIQVSVMYRGKDGNVCCASRRMEAACALEGKSRECLAASDFGDWNCTIEPTNEISVKFDVDYEIHEFESLQLSIPHRVETQNESLQENNKPSVVVRRILPGETLWKIAKEYRTTVDDIMHANSLESDLILAGDMILIPKKR